MRVLMSGRMKGLLTPGEVHNAFERDPITPELCNYVSQGVVFEHGCAFLRALWAGDPSFRLDRFPDLTGAECFVNHVHLADLGIAASKEQLCESVALAGAIARLGRPERLRFIISLKDAECVWRFHRRRRGERWLDDDLESYREEALLVIDVP